MRKMSYRMAESVLGRRAKILISLLMLITGLAFYWGYALFYGEWNLLAPGNDGVYSVVVFFAGSGVLGLLLFSKKPAEQ